MLQGEMHLSGRVRSIDLAAVGRRSAEQEWDLLELLAPDACAAARAAPPPAPRRDDDAPGGRPTARELLDAVREFLAEHVATNDDRALAYQGRVAANVLAIVERELAQEHIVRDGDDWETLALTVRDKLTIASPRHLSLPPTIASA
jgi:hypothetical protein